MSTSQLLPDLDLELLAHCVQQLSRIEAMRGWRAAVRFLDSVSELESSQPVLPLVMSGGCMSSPDTAVDFEDDLFDDNLELQVRSRPSGMGAILILSHTLAFNRVQILQLGFVSLILGGVVGEAAIAQPPVPPLSNFTTLCQNKENLSPDQRQAIDTWLNQAGTQDCHRATQVLSAPLQSNPANPYHVNEYRVINVPPLSIFNNPSGNPTNFRIQFGQPQ